MVDDYKKQKRIGLISFIGVFIMMLAHLFLFAFCDLSTCYNSTVLNFFTYLFISIPFFVSILKNSIYFKNLQVVCYVIFSIIVSVSNQSPTDITAIFFLAYASTLFIVYNKDNSKQKFAVLFVIVLLTLFCDAFLNSIFRGENYFVSCVGIVSNNNAILFFKIVANIAFIGSFIGLMWATFWEDLKYLLEKSNKLQVALYKSEGEAWYGRNVIGVVHNIKNKLTPVYLLLEEFSHDERIDKETRDFCKTQIKSVDGLSGLLDKLMYSTKIKNKEDLETININKTIKSVVEFFKSNMEFKKNINLNIKQHGFDIYFKGNPMNFCFVIENIIKNSYDNLKKLNKEKIIDIEIFNKNSVKFVSIKDNGTGVSLINEDEFSGSLLDCHFFKIGNTTKKDGLGYGMEFIKSFLIENKINANIYTKKNFGTEIKIFFN